MDDNKVILICDQLPANEYGLVRKVYRFTNPLDFVDKPLMKGTTYNVQQLETEHQGKIWTVMRVDVNGNPTFFGAYATEQAAHVHVSALRGIIREGYKVKVSECDVIDPWKEEHSPYFIPEMPCL